MPNCGDLKKRNQLFLDWWGEGDSVRAKYRAFSAVTPYCGHAL